MIAADLANALSCVRCHVASDATQDTGRRVAQHRLGRAHQPPRALSDTPKTGSLASTPAINQK